MSQLNPTYARGSGRDTPVFIVPEADIYAQVPNCVLCTWVAAGPGRMRLKFLSAGCREHEPLPRRPA